MSPAAGHGADEPLLWIAFASAVLLAAVHVFSHVLRMLDGVPRSRLLSALGGMAVAFAILRLLPAVAGHQETLERAARGTVFEALNNHAYVLLLASLILFYGMERLARRSQWRSAAEGGPVQTGAGVFWLHTASFALMNLLIGYMLVSYVRADRSVKFLLLFTAAMFFKFLVNDHGLHRLHGQRYDAVGRWVLVGALFLGWGVSYLMPLPEVAPALLQAFIAGGVLLNVLKEELPDERESRFWVFVAGAVAYSLLLVSF